VQSLNKDCVAPVHDKIWTSLMTYLTTRVTVPVEEAEALNVGVSFSPRAPSFLDSSPVSPPLGLFQDASLCPAAFWTARDSGVSRVFQETFWNN